MGTGEGGRRCGGQATRETSAGEGRRPAPAGKSHPARPAAPGCASRPLHLLHRRRQPTPPSAGNCNNSRTSDNRVCSARTSSRPRRPDCWAPDDRRDERWRPRTADETAGLSIRTSSGHNMLKRFVSADSYGLILLLVIVTYLLPISFPTGPGHSVVMAVQIATVWLVCAQRTRHVRCGSWRRWCSSGWRSWLWPMSSLQ